MAYYLWIKWRIEVFERVFFDTLLQRTPRGTVTAPTRSDVRAEFVPSTFYHSSTQYRYSFQLFLKILKQIHANSDL